MSMLAMVFLTVVILQADGEVDYTKAEIPEGKAFCEYVKSIITSDFSKIEEAHARIQGYTNKDRSLNKLLYVECVNGDVELL